MQPPDPRAILRHAGLTAKKSWGQNFLLDQAALRDIAEATGASDEQPVVELGAGLGALTWHLLQAGGDVLAVERDREIVPLLREALAGFDRLQIEEADAAHLDYGELAERLGGPIVVAGNLPYQISSRILVSVADARAAVLRAVFLVQREVALRLAAPPGGKTYGLLSVLAQRAVDVELLRDVKPGAFLPRPKVTSSVVRLTPHDRRPSPEEDAWLVAAARAAFSRRRKTLRNSVAGGLGAEAATVEAAIVAAGLDPKTRAETLPVEAFCQLGRALAGAGLLVAGAEDQKPK